MPYQIDNYTVYKTLGSGAQAKVKLCKNASGESFAMKVFDKSNPLNTAEQLNVLKTEVEVYRALKHPNIISLIDFQENGVKTRSNGQKVNVAYMVMELVTGGDLYDYVALRPFSPEICRFYVKQMLKTLHFMHSAGVVHRDLKPENILLDSNYNLKIADFGFAAPIQGRDRSGYLKTQLGTMQYMAPEIILNTPYQGNVVDLYSLGVIIFSMFSGHPPFTKAHDSDSHFKLMHKNPAKYWEKIEFIKKSGFYSPEYKQFISGMLAMQPSARPSMSDLIGHKWLQGPTATHEQVVADFKARQAENQAAQNKNAEVQKAKPTKKRVVRSDSDTTYLNMKLTDYGCPINKNTVLFSSEEP